jgi:hypothetical protein
MEAIFNNCIRKIPMILSLLSSSYRFSARGGAGMGGLAVLRTRKLKIGQLFWFVYNLIAPDVAQTMDSLLGSGSQEPLRKGEAK